MLTGKTPIPGTNAMEVLTNLATMEARPLRERDRSVRGTGGASSSNALEREPSARYTRRGRWPRTWALPQRRASAGARRRAPESLAEEAREHRVLVSVVSSALVLVLRALGQAAVTNTTRQSASV